MFPHHTVLVSSPRFLFPQILPSCLLMFPLSLFPFLSHLLSWLYVVSFSPSFSSCFPFSAPLFLSLSSLCFVSLFPFLAFSFLHISFPSSLSLSPASSPLLVSQQVVFCIKGSVHIKHTVHSFNPVCFYVVPLKTTPDESTRQETLVRLLRPDVDDSASRAGLDPFGLISLEGQNVSGGLSVVTVRLVLLPSGHK